MLKIRESHVPGGKVQEPNFTRCLLWRCEEAGGAGSAGSGVPQGGPGQGVFCSFGGGGHFAHTCEVGGPAEWRDVKRQPVKQTLTDRRKWMGEYKWGTEQKGSLKQAPGEEEGTLNWMRVFEPLSSYGAELCVCACVCGSRSVCMCVWMQKGGQR